MTGRFSFGRNWADYSREALDDEARQRAREHLRAWLARLDPPPRSLLDVGCGSGLFLVAAADLGLERIVGFDYDPKCVEVARENCARLLGDDHPVEVRPGDALDAAFLESLGTFDLVYAWGSLHHTGDMWSALRRVARCVAPGGALMVALYNHTWSSPLWTGIKWLYNQLPGPLRPALVAALTGPAAIAKALYTRQNPFRQRRGMSFWHNMVDWVGGYPYEYARPQAVIRFFREHGFELLHLEPAPTPIACNEFLFRRREPAGTPDAPAAGLS